MKKKMCFRCKTLQVDEEFSEKKGRSNNVCKTCVRKYDREYHLARDKESKDRKEQLQYKRLQNIKIEINKYKQNNPCPCGESFVGCLEFHHIDSSNKEINIANSHGWSLKHIMKEIDKCIVLCSNCHRKLHAGVLIIDKTEKWLSLV